jgi:CBS domain-containing protein
MIDMPVSDLMRPLDRYTTVSFDATLEDVFLALEGALRGARKADPAEPRDFAVLVLDGERRVLGRLGVWDVLQGLEPQAGKRVDALAMVDGYEAWDRPLAGLTSKTRNLRAADLVKALSRVEYIGEEESLDVALRRLVDHRLLSLIVTRGPETIGILRVVDVFQHVCNRLRSEREG